jgi:hypothetical protein
MFIMKSFYLSGGSYVAMERQYCREFFLLCFTIESHCLPDVKRSEETGSVCDKCARRCKCRALVYMESVSASQEAITRSPRKCVQHVAQYE